MRLRPSRPSPALGDAVRRLRETPVPPTPPDLLDRLVAPAALRTPRGSLRFFFAAGATLATLAVLAYRETSPSNTKVLVWRGQPRPVALALPTAASPTAKTDPVERRPVQTRNRAPSERPKAPPTIDFTFPAPFANKLPARLDDLAFLNPGGKGLFTEMNGRATEALPPMRDDFVAPPDVVLAANGSPEEAREWDRAVRERYAHEAQVVDARLVKNVTLALKHASMAEVCEELTRQTGVRIEAGRNVRDENATIFAGPRPAREVMREIGRVFAFVWERDGEEGAYVYRLKQETVAQVAEERMRNDDVAQAIGTMTHVVRHERGAETTADFCREAFADLLPDELARLRSGGTVMVDGSVSGTSELEPRIAQGLLASQGGIVHNPDGSDSLVGKGEPNATSLAEIPGAKASVIFKMKITEFGGARLDASVFVNTSGFSFGQQVGLGEAPGVADGSPQNANANAALSAKPEMARTVTLSPRPTVPLARQGVEVPAPASNTVHSMFAGYRTVAGLKPPRPYMASDDLWQTVHETTGRDVIADSFSRLFPLETYKGRLFDALCAAGDSLHQRWSEDGGWLVARSRAYAWQRTNEVPKARLARWAAVQAAHGGALPLETVVEMGTMSDRQLDSVEVGKTIANQWGLLGWGLPSRPLWSVPFEPIRPFCRFMAALAPGQLDLLRAGELGADKVPLEELGGLQAGFGLQIEPTAVLGVEYVPAGKYFWSPFFEDGRDTVHDDLILGDTAEAVESEVHRRYPDRPRGEVEYSDGRLTLLLRRGESTLRQGDGHFMTGHREP